MLLELYYTKKDVDVFDESKYEYGNDFNADIISKNIYLCNWITWNMISENLLNFEASKIVQDIIYILHYCFGES